MMSEPEVGGMRQEEIGNAAKSDEQIINELQGCVSILCLVD